jgi:diketogulonate reductase-like aldo/keto reductase
MGKTLMENLDELRVRNAVRSLQVILPDGRPIPRLGQGTWHMGEKAAKADDEIESLRLGIRLGMTLIDTAEMYGNGGAEEVVGEAIGGIPREELFLVSKVYPHNAGRKNIFKSCEASLRRMRVDCLDLYLLHWRGSVLLHETVSCMEELKRDGMIKGWGVSNFDTEDMEELFRVPGGEACQTNQVLYHLGSRGIEFDLLPWMMRKGLPFMAYSPLAQAGRLKSGLLNSGAVAEVGRRHGAQNGQVLLAFVLRLANAVVIPKAGSLEHTAQNAASALLALSEDDLVLLEAAFPVPGRKVSLDIS